MIGQLHDAGNTTTLAHYLTLLDGAGLLAGIEKHSVEIVRRKASSPKFQVLNNALMSASLDLSFSGAVSDPRQWGRFVESAAGTHLLAGRHSDGYVVSYWRDRDDDVEFVLRKGERLVAIELKSGSSDRIHHGLEVFRMRHANCSCLLVGGQGMPLEEFLSIPPSELF